MALPKLKSAPQSNRPKLLLAVGLLVVAGGFMGYSLWGGSRPGTAEPAGTPPPESAPPLPDPVPAAKAQQTKPQAAAPAKAPAKEGGRMVPTDAKPGGA